jgi:flagellar hook-associated protein 2
MSDFSIPGVTSKYQTAEIIDKLMEVERIPLTRMEDEVDTFKKQKSVWLSLNRKISTFRDNSREIYSFQNPFNSKIAESSDTNILTANATRTALEEKKKIIVKQTAQADRFLSRSLDKDFQPEKGLYRFKVGDKEVKFNFSGGSLKELAALINKRGTDLIRASLVADSDKSQVMAIEGLKTGIKNPLSLHDQALEFGITAGFIKKSGQAEQSITPDRYTITPWLLPLDETMYTLQEGSLTLKPGTEMKIPVKLTGPVTEGMVLELEIKTEIIPEEETGRIVPPSGPLIPAAGSIEYQDITIQNDPSQVVLPPWDKPEIPIKIDDLQVLFLEGGLQTVALPEISDSEDFQLFRFQLQQSEIDTINLRNRNTHRLITLQNIRIRDTQVRGEYTPVKPLSTVSDALLSMDGIEITRDSNNINDLIPGVELSLHSKGDRAVSLTIERDREVIIEAIIELVGNYNQLLTHIDILTRRDESVIEDALFLTEDEKEWAEKNLGLFLGNQSLRQLKTRLQNIMMNPYPTSGKSELSLLAHIGIATNATAPGRQSSLSKTRLRGYLEIEESKLDSAISAHPDWVKELFGYDGDNDLIIDNGVAFILDQYLKPYVDTGGIISSRLNGLDGKISRKNRDIAVYNRHLEDYEAELRRKYGRMEAALDALERSSKALDNFNRTGSDK